MLLSAWGIALFSAIFMGFSGVFLVVIAISYYVDYKKNKRYYTDVLVFWSILLCGAAIIYVIFNAILNVNILGWFLIGAWLMWVSYRLGFSDKSGD
ncbi:MAG: hypothetical protein KG003_09945 [Bacteroidetes bacterium]|nr:hypothetical protein [Bacteroidota bacterium]